MKLTYEQMRHLAELGDGEGRITLKNKKGVTLKPTLKKWHQSQTTKETKSMFLEAPQRQSLPRFAHQLLPRRARGLG